jgi:hypothetical protein
MTDQRGLIITTSGFTKDAVNEAVALGKAPISLLDGKRLIQLLVEKQIGVRRKAVHLLELNFGELVVGGDAGGDAAGEKSAVLWPLPGGRHAYFDTLLAFIDYINATEPTVDQMTDWVKKHYEKVTKNKVVQSYLRNVLYSIGVIDFDGERVIVTEQGKHIHGSRKPDDVVMLLKENIVGVE